MSDDAIPLRNCTELDEFRACVALQKEVWGFADNELVPLRIFSLAPKIGGQVIGAWDGDTLVGFAFSIPGTRSGHAYLHSHMLAREERLSQQRAGPAHQAVSARGRYRAWLRADGVDLRSAGDQELLLQPGRLGAIARRYNINQYGITSSPLQGFLPTDRLVAEWWLSSKRVETLLATGTAAGVSSQKRGSKCRRRSTPGRRSGDAAESGRHVQLRNREQFLKAFSRWLACLGYERDASGNGVFLLGHWDEAVRMAGRAGSAWFQIQLIRSSVPNV